MPDMERLLREMEIDLAETPADRATLRDRFRRTDRLRWRIVWACLLLAGFATLIAALISSPP